MDEKNQLACWEITQCKKSAGCPARKHPERLCWEIAQELSDYRSAFNVCKDCIVYLSKNKNSSLTEEDVREILSLKGVCVLASHCEQHVSK